ncbi:MAG TPA: hypothetical protein VGL68_02685 [Solirubrobacteraceae bacterium]
MSVLGGSDRVDGREGMSGPRALNLPRPARVRARSDDGVPVQVDGEPIEHVRESWLVEDRWWTARPLRRRYWEVVSVRGRNLVVFHDLQESASGSAGGWFSQAA